MAYRGEEEFLDIDVEVIDIEKQEEVLQKIQEYAPDIIHVHIWEGEWYSYRVLRQIFANKFSRKHRKIGAWIDNKMPIIFLFCKVIHNILANKNVLVNVVSYNGCSRASI